MKKAFIILIVSALVLTACGKKQEEESSEEIILQPMTEVITPPTEVQPEAEQNSVGLMAFYPNDNENMFALYGTNAVTFYFENKNVMRGDAKIGVYEADTNAIYASVDASDTSSYEVGEMDSVGTSLTGWTQGTKIDVYFPKLFELGKSYYVLIDEGAFKLGGVSSAPVTNASLINFTVKDYGIDLTGINLDKVYNVGDSINFNVIIDSVNATMYALKEYDAAFIEATPSNSTQSTPVSITFLKPGEPSFSVGFYKSGKVVDSMSFTFHVQGDVDTSAEATSN